MLFYIISFLILILLVYFSKSNENFNNNNILSLNEIYQKNALMNNIEYVYNIPKVVFIVWFGRKISNNRLLALNSLIKNIKVPYILITEDNYLLFEKKNNKIHKAFKYLSGNHKSDYLRSYLLHHYGGGYHDIKFRNKDLKNEWETFRDKKIWIKSRPERHHNWIGYDIDNPKTKFITQKYKELGTMGWVICRPSTMYTKELIDKINKKLDIHYKNLKKFPSTNASGYYADTPFEKVKNKNAYPLRWLELMGEHFHLLMYKYKNHMNLELPDAESKSYK
jgi:hypothetical protein